MDIQLTPQQLEELDAGGEGATRVIDPRTNATYVLVSEAEYETVQDVIEEEKRQRHIREIALQNAVGRMDDSP